MSTMFNRMVQDRICGTCNLCCDLPEVKELEKPENCICEYWNRHKGCTIHEFKNRPESCKSFRCYWLDGILPFMQRPDTTDVLIFEGEYQGKIAVYYLEKIHHKAVDQYIRLMTQQIKAKKLVVISYKGNRSFIGFSA